MYCILYILVSFVNDLNELHVLKLIIKKCKTLHTVKSLFIVGF